jgi:hypothetical protein
LELQRICEDLEEWEERYKTCSEEDEGGRAAAVKGGGGLPGHVRGGDRAGIAAVATATEGWAFVACRLAALPLLSGPLASRLAAWSRFLPTYLLPTSPHDPWLVPTPLPLLSSDTGAVSQNSLSSANQKLPFSVFSKYPMWCVGSL